MHHIVLPSSRYVIHCVLTTIQDSTLTEERRGQSQHSYITNKLSFPQNKNLYCTGGEESEPKLAAKNTNLQVSPVWCNKFWLARCRLQETLKWLFSSLRIVTAQFGLMRYLYLKLWCRSSVKCADRLACWTSVLYNKRVLMSKIKIPEIFLQLYQTCNALFFAAIVFEQIFDLSKKNVFIVSIFYGVDVRVKRES